MKTSGDQRPILFAALNWGMGHASRSVPLIRELQRRQIPLILGSDGVAAELLRAEFPDLDIRELPSYKVTYPSRNIYINVLKSVWTILLAILAERRWVRSIHRQTPLRAVISDNRYGLRLSGIPSVLITHQLHFNGPWAWANRIGEWSVRWWARRFTEIWVPDWAGNMSLSGGMATWRYTSPPVYYLGPLSRFPLHQHGAIQPEYDIIAILSGPEPQRTSFEQILRDQLNALEGRHLMVRGTRDAVPAHWPEASFEVMDLLPAEALNELVSRSTMQISRSGYSTVMDLAYSGIPALMIPTPGQIEQEYLAVYLLGKGPWCFQNQDDLDIRQAWTTRNQWALDQPNRPSGQEASQAVDSFLQRLDTL
ncbi:MAG: glycosyltransferase [Saprospiraceae bacterium]